MLNGIAWVLTHIAQAFVDLAWALTHPGSWLSWLGGLDDDAAKEALMRFIYYGGSANLFFAVFVVAVILTVAGMVRRPVLWGAVRGLEAFGNGIGRIAAWAGLLMVLQQTIIVFVQRIFAQSEIAIGFGAAFSRDVSWWSEELKLYNALIVTLCVSWTFIQGGHVRVDLVYAGVSYRAKKMIDMVGSLVFMMPMALLTWHYAWYFMWRNLINPPVSSSDPLDRMLLKAKAVRWSVETIGFSPNGFDAYFLFKILMLLFAALVFLQALAFFWRSWLEWKEGPFAENRYLDRDVIEPGEVEMAAPERLAHPHQGHGSH